MTTENQKPIVERLEKRIDQMLRHGRVQDPELMVSALEVLTELADATSVLLKHNREPRDYLEKEFMDRCANVIAKINGDKNV